MRIGSILKENEMDRAQLILAAKAVVDDMQDMAEKLAKMEAEGIMPLLDGIRTQFGPEFADRLNTDATSALRTALDALADSKSQIGMNITNMEQMVTGEGPGNDMSTGAGLEEPAPEAVVDPEAAVAEVPGGDEVAADSEAASQDDIEDVFGADAETDSVGRETKESAVQKNINMLRESANPDRLVMASVMQRMKAGKNGKTAVMETARSFAIDAQDVLDIVKQFTKK